jgi:glyoxylase-like metal-dependent hydrolase (beta-lactamase superfamily II)
MRIVDNLYAYVWQGNDNNCNTYVFASVFQDGKHLVIDPGHLKTPFYQEPGLEKLFTEMEKEGLDSARIGLVILTHAHPDHCQAAMAIREKRQALIAMHEMEAVAYQQMGGKADFYLVEGDLQLDGKKPLKLMIYHSPGHSPGHITLYWPENKVLIAGDVIFYHSTGRADLSGGNSRILKESIQKLSQLDIEYLLCGHPYGHSGVIQGKAGVQENFEFLRRNILF